MFYIGVWCSWKNETSNLVIFVEDKWVSICECVIAYRYPANIFMSVLLPAPPEIDKFIFRIKINVPVRKLLNALFQVHNENSLTRSHDSCQFTRTKQTADPFQYRFIAFPSTFWYWKWNIVECYIHRRQFRKICQRHLKNAQSLRYTISVLVMRLEFWFVNKCLKLPQICRNSWSTTAVIIL